MKSARTNKPPQSRHGLSTQYQDQSATPLSLSPHPHPPHHNHYKTTPPTPTGTLRRLAPQTLQKRRTPGRRVAVLCVVFLVEPGPSVSQCSCIHVDDLTKERGRYLEVGIKANAFQERRRQRPPNAAPTTLELARAKRRVTLHEHADAGETVQRRHPPSRYCRLPLIFGRPAVSIRKEDQN